MKKNQLSRRKFLQSAAVGVGGIVLASCVPTAPPGQQAAAPSQEVITLEHMSRADFESQRLAIEEWNQTHPDVQIRMDEVVGDTWDYYRIKMMQQLAAGNPPDTVFTDVWYFRLYSEDGVFRNLEDYIDVDTEFEKDDLWEVCVTNTSSPDINGDMYCLPYDYGTHCLAFNKAIFDEEGVPYLEADQEYDWEQDILPLAVEFTRDLNGNKPTDSGFDPLRIDRYGVNPYSYLFWWYIDQAGGSCFNSDFTAATMNTPEAVEGIQFLYNLMSQYYVSPSPAYQQSQPISFQTGKIAMSIVATWDLAGWVPSIDFDWDIVRPPRRQVRIGDGRVSGMAMLSETQIDNHAWEWIKYLSIGRGQDFKQQLGGAIHPIKTKAENEIFMNRTLPPFNMGAFLHEADLGGGPPLFRYWHMFIDMVPAELQRAYVDEISVQEALDGIVEQTNYLLAEGRLP